MTNEERLKADISLRIRQLEYIKDKVKRINRYSEFTDIRLFAYKLEDIIKGYKGALSSDAAWYRYKSIAENDKVTDSVLFNMRLDTFVYEVYYEVLAVNYNHDFFGFYHPNSFNLFGITTELMMSKGMYNGNRVPEYVDVIRKIKENPTLAISRERTKVTEYIKKGYETTVAKRAGKPLPLDMSVPGGY